MGSKDEKDRVTYYDALLVSHIQHAQMTRAYFDDVSRMDGTAPPRPDQRRFDARAEETRMSAAERELEIDRLQQELDQLTDEANRRIERGNRDISRLKAQLKQLNDVEGPQVKREHEDAEQVGRGQDDKRRAEAARLSTNQLQCKRCRRT